MPLRFSPPTSPRISAATFGRVGIIAAAVILFLCEIFMTILPDWGNALVTLAWVTLFCGGLALSAFFPLWGGVFVLLVAVSETFVESGVSIAYWSVYVIVGMWMSRGWYVPALVSLAVVDGLTLWTSATPLAHAGGMLIGWPCALMGGLMVKYYRDLAQARAELAKEATRREIEALLHDTVTQELVQIVLLSESMTEDSHDVPTARRINRVATAALGDLRKLGTRSRQDLLDHDITQVAAMCRGIVEEHGLHLVTYIAPELSETLTSRQRQVLNLAIREGTMNAVKYATPGSTIRLELESLPEEPLCLSIANAVDGNTEPPTRGVSGGFGLEDLHAATQEAGGDMVVWQAQGQWNLRVSLPAALPGTAETRSA